MSTIAPPAEHRFVLEPIRWTTYLAIVHESRSASGRMTYDQGVLEIMSPLLPHESAKSLLGRMIEMFTFLRHTDIRTSASTTFSRADLERSFEADESYYIQNAPAIHGKTTLDLSMDPPPDSVIEIEMTRSAIDKLQLFASIRIPEVWRYDGTDLTIHSLVNDRYEPTATSHVLGGFPVKLAESLLARRADESETKLMRQFVVEVEQE